MSIGVDMSESKAIVEQLKQQLDHQLQEWLGSNIPKEGTDDYERWQSRQQAIDDVQTIYDVQEYLDSEGIDSDQFFIDSQTQLLNAGMEPDDISAEVVTALGREVDREEWAGGSWSTVYEYNGLWFVIDEVEMRYFQTIEDAKRSAAIGDDDFDRLRD
jgi:hypothetical protein